MALAAACAPEAGDLSRMLLCFCQLPVSFLLDHRSLQHCNVLSITLLEKQDTSAKMR